METVNEQLVAFVQARLDEWERLARQALPLQTGSRDQGQPAEHVSWRRGAGHPEFALRHITTLREVASSAAHLAACGDKLVSIIGETMLMQLASSWPGHPDYRAGWAV